MTFARRRLNRSARGTMGSKVVGGATLNPERVTDSKPLSSAGMAMESQQCGHFELAGGGNERGGASIRPSGSQSQSNRVCFSAAAAAAAALLHSVILS